MAEDTKDTSGVDSPDVLQAKIDQLTQEKTELIDKNSTLAQENSELVQKEKQLNEEKAELKEENDSLKLQLLSSNQEAEEDTTGIPAVLKYNGAKYTREEVLADKKIFAELQKLGYVKSQKK